MATKKKTAQKKTLAEREAVLDPRAELDSKQFLKAAAPVLAALAADLLQRADQSPAVTRALQARHGAERAAQRTADNYEVWRRAFVGQVADAWLLSVVFVRTLEDRGLLASARIAGSGALDSQRLFSELAPSLTARDYLLTVFKELSRFPAVAALFDARHNPVWKLGPSDEVSKKLLELFRLPSAEAPAFRFGQTDTRFLGDLYQDLDEDVRKRFALLQTPRFVESFILDRTLEPAIERFGLDEATLIDPTCGSGHFLLGAFDRLYEHQLRAHPGLSSKEAAHKALDAIAGSDINPYAVAIARFRLTLSYLDKTTITRLSDAPELPLHLAVADSLLHNPQGKLEGQKEIWETTQASLFERPGQTAREWLGEEFALEDEEAARDVLHKRYAAVVGNPPYITVKDAVLRDRYREMYASASGKYSLGVPFTERFFQLARAGGSVGMITANSFMKREFGKTLIEEYLPALNLTEIINTSGAYIPGHGTPTVLLFGSAETPQKSDVLAVLAKRGEPTTPDDAEQGLVWRSIADHGREIGFDNDYITVALVDREQLAKHPWSLAGGGAGGLKALLEDRAETTLSDVADSIGIASFTLEDDVYLRPLAAWQRMAAPSTRVRAMVTGEMIRDWSVEPDLVAIFPYNEKLEVVGEGDPVPKLLWPFRTCIANNKLFGNKTKVEGGLKWYEFGRLTTNKLRTPLTITFAFVATHNHFVLDRGGKVFNRSAPIIKLPEGATEEDHLALLAYLNSSTACFWMKQVMMDKGSGTDTGGWQDDPAKARFEFAGTQMALLPVPGMDERRRTVLGDLAHTIVNVAEERCRLRDQLATQIASAPAELDALLVAAEARDRALEGRMIGCQEEIDWQVYGAFDLVDVAPVREEVAATLGSRPFEVAMGRAGSAAGIDGQRLATEAASEKWSARVDAPAAVAILESSDFKRRWRTTPKATGGRPISFREVVLSTVAELVRDSLENLVRGLTAARTFPQSEELNAVAGALGIALARVTEEEAVPFLAANRYTEAGLEKHRAWQHTWNLQRREDEGQAVGEIPVPPKYDQKDFRDARSWSLRGKLDVPKERFIAYPGCESDEDKEPIYGWAGWTHLQRAQALAELYQKRKDEGWDKARLTPMLAGLLELIPWVQQWHNEPSDAFGGLRLGDYFKDFLQAECATHNLTEQDLLDWRPSDRKSKAKGKGKAQGRARRSDRALAPAPDEWPTASESAFEEMALQNPQRLERWVLMDELTAGHKTLAAQVLGKRGGPAAIPSLLRLLHHASALVREGAVLGLAHHATDEVLARLREVSENDASKGVRASAKQAVEALTEA